MNKKIIVPAAVAAVIVSAASFGAIGASAQNATNPQANIVQAISEKFSLNEAEVQAVFDAERESHHEQMESKMEERLDEAVQNGDITEAQKNIIIAKHEEMEQDQESNREEMKNMTPEERKAAIESKKDEIDAWAEENGIEMKLFPFGGMRGGMHRGFQNK